MWKRKRERGRKYLEALSKNGKRNGRKIGETGQRRSGGRGGAPSRKWGIVEVQKVMGDWRGRGRLALFWKRNVHGEINWRGSVYTLGGREGCFKNSWSTAKWVGKMVNGENKRRRGGRLGVTRVKLCLINDWLKAQRKILPRACQTVDIKELLFWALIKNGKNGVLCRWLTF